MSGVVTVFASGNWADIATAKLILETEEIRFIAEGEGVQDLFAFGRTFTGYNTFTGPVQLRVAAEEAERALEALDELRRSSGHEQL